MIVTQAEYTAWLQAAAGTTLTAAQLTFLGVIHPWVERVVWRVLGYSLEQATHTEYLPQPGAERYAAGWWNGGWFDSVGGWAVQQGQWARGEGVLQLTNVPARSITSVYENPAAYAAGTVGGDWPTTSLLPATAYRLDANPAGVGWTGFVVRTLGTWAAAPRTVKVTYVAGFSQAEIDAGYGDVKMAILQALAWWFGRATLGSKAVKGGGVTAMQLSIRDFSVTLGNPMQMAAGAGGWAQNVLGPDALNLLMGFINVAGKYVGTF